MTPLTISSAKLRSNLAKTLDSATNNNVIIIKRRGKEDVSLVNTAIHEDFIASQNPRIIKKVAQARASKKSYSHEEVFGEM